MAENQKNDNQWLEVIIGLSQTLRFCGQNEAFCEGVTFHQFMTMEALSQKDKFSMRELNDKLGVAKSTATRLVAPLIEKKLLKKFKDTNDSRIIRLSLTLEGHKVHKAVRLCLLNFIEQATNHIPLSQKEITLQSLTTFIEAIKAAKQHTDCCNIS